VVEDAQVQTERRSAWEEAYRAEAPRLWRSLLLFTGDPELASDALAEAFAQGIARGEAVRSPGAWVWKTAFVLARAELGRSRSPAPESPSYDVGVQPEEVLDVMIALRTVSPMQRASLVLHHYAGYPVREVADILGTSRSAVGVHLFRARARVRRELGSDDDD
jgi:RNA polymerase sigma-70 factor (ECF subfamily)